MRLANHEENEELAKEVDILANKKDLKFYHNKSSSRYGNFDGWHRYVIIDPKISQNKTIRSRGLIYYTEARFCKYFKPSIIRERIALTDLKAMLREK